jgi:hypothetical protein
MAEDGAVTRERLPRQPVLPRRYIDFGLDMLQPEGFQSTANVRGFVNTRM